MEKEKAEIKIQEVEEKNNKPTITLKDKIDSVVDKYIENKDDLKKQIFNLVQRILYPEQFCPDCDERMFFDSSVYKCPNCGYKSSPIIKTESKNITQSTVGKVPDVVENAISEANASMMDIPTTSNLGDKIRKLVNERDSGGMAPTKEDEAVIKGSDKNVANKINWV
jgi:DNA-directed RNA polymerase subunit M/transcription elongation factor TFIIS